MSEKYHTNRKKNYYLSDKKCTLTNNFCLSNVQHLTKVIFVTYNNIVK